MAVAPQPVARPAPTVDLLPAAQVRLELLVRKLDLLERRVAHREVVVAELKAATAPVASAGDLLTSDMDRLTDLDDRIGRLERRGFGTTPGGAALDFARFEPNEARAGETVSLTVQVESFKKGDRLEFVITDILAETTFEPLNVDIPDENPAGVALAWKVPPGTPGRDGAFRFTVKGRECEARSPVLTVRG